MTDSQNLKMCLPCPMNTVTAAIGATVCGCVDGYFRDEQTNEGPEVDCTSMSDSFNVLGCFNQTSFDPIPLPCNFGSLLKINIP